MFLPVVVSHRFPKKNELSTITLDWLPMVFYGASTSSMLRTAMTYEFIVQSIHPPEDSEAFYHLLADARTDGYFAYKPMVQETPAPPGFVKEILTITASTLAVIDVLYAFYERIKAKRGKVFVHVQGDTLDLATYDVKALKAKIPSSE